MFRLQQQADVDQEANELGRKLASTFGVEHNAVEINDFFEDCVGGFYTGKGVWYTDAWDTDILVSFKIEHDEVTKVSLHLSPA